MPQSPASASPAVATVNRPVERGDRPGRTVVLHAAGSSPRALDRFATELAQWAGRVVVPALQNDGASLIGGGPDPFAAAVALTRDLLSSEITGPRLLVGHSMGGLIALLAMTGGVEVDAAILYEPITLSLLDAAEAGDRAARDWDRACIERFRERCRAGDPEAGVAGFVEAYGEVPWSQLPATVRTDLVARAPIILGEATATNAAQLDPHLIRQIAVPVVLLQGSRSPDVARRMVARLAALLPGAACVTVEGAGHMGPVSRPTAVALPIADVLRSRGLFLLP